MTFYVWHYRKSNICLGWDSASEGFYLKVHLILFSITTDYFFPQFPVVESIWERTKAERLEHLIFKTIFEYTKDRRLQQVRMAPPCAAESPQHWRPGRWGRGSPVDAHCPDITHLRQMGMPAQRARNLKVRKHTSMVFPHTICTPDYQRT